MDPGALTFQNFCQGQAAAQDQTSYSRLTNEHKVDRVERDSAAHKAASQSANSAPDMPAHIAPPAAHGTQVQASQPAGRLQKRPETCRKRPNTYTHTHVHADKINCQARTQCPLRQYVNVHAHLSTRIHTITHTQ
jgi:hypothetical protein